MGNVIQVGQEMYGIGINTDSTDALNGQVVALVGAQGNRAAFVLADGSAIATSSMVGMLTTDCAQLASCPVTTFGYVRGLDTSAWTAGTKLYLNATAPGNLTNSTPTLPNNPVWVGTVLRSHASVGVIFVFPRTDPSDGLLSQNIYSTGNITVDGKINGVNISNLTEGPHTVDTDTTYTNGTGLSEVSEAFSILLGYQMPQGCNDGEIAEYNTTSGGWDCAIDNSASSGMASWVLAASDSGGSEIITDGETVTFADDNQYLTATRSTNTVTYSIIESILNATIGSEITSTVTQSFIEAFGFVTGAHTVDTNTQVQGDGNYLTNDSTTMYFNETKLNLTIDDRDSDSYPGDFWVNTSGDTMTGNLNMSNNNITDITKITFSDVSLKQLEANSEIDGSVMGVMMTNPPNQELPHLIIQSGGPSQASVLLRSFMIQNEINDFSNTTAVTSCISYMAEIGETLKIDCNTTTTGADLLVSDDFQVVGDVWLKDSDGEWHFMTRELALNDELRDNSVTSKLNVSITDDNLSLVESGGDTIAVVINEATTFLGTTDSILLTTGTNASPIFNHIYYNGGGTPTLTVSTTEQTGVADVSQVLEGANYSYASIGGSATGSEFIRGVYRRFLDDGALYKSGFDIAASSTELNFTTGTIKIMLQDFDITTAHDTDDTVIEINSTGNYIQHIGDLNGFSQYSDGGTITNNRYFNMVCGVAVTIDMGGRMYCVPQNEPSSEFNSISNAETDSTYTLFFPSDDFVKKLFIPVARVVMQRSGGANTIQTLSNGNLYLDIRGTISGAGAPPTPGVSSHSNLDNLEWDVAGHLFNDAGQTMDIGSYNLTTSEWLNGKLNASDVQNAPWSEGAHTTDTNANTICTGATTYLDGEGNCNNIDNVYLTQANEGNLDVNSSNYWDNYNTANTTQIENNGGVLSIVLSWFSSEFDSLFSSKTTDDLTEGSTNLYNNDSWNESHADSRYVDRSDWTTIDNYPAACGAGEYVSQIGDTITCSTPTGTTYSAGNGISLAGTTFSVAAGTALTQDAAGLSVSSNAIGDSQLTFDTGQALTSTSAVTFATVDTGQGANELYDMDQNVLTTSSPTFGGITVDQFSITTVNITCLNAACTFYANATDGCIQFPSGGAICDLG